MARSITDRMMGAATLDVATYEEVEADTTATGQAATVVALAAVASAIGAMGRGGSGIITMLLGTLIGWAIWSWITYFIGTRLFGGTATWGELARTIGFAQTPRVLLILAILPVIGGIVGVAVAIWVLIAGIIAIRQALDVTTGKAVLTAIIGWVVAIIPMALLGARM
jgi:hypothetical protein